MKALVKVFEDNTHLMEYVASMIVILLTGVLATFFWDNDGYWIIAEGRNILQNGFSLVNTLLCGPNEVTICHAWLWCVGIAYIYDTFNNIGLFLFNWVILACIYFLCVKFINDRTNNLLNSILVTIIPFVVYSYWNIRPERISLLLCLLECIILEQAIVNNKYKLLYLLPIIAVIEVNVHSSHWIIHLILVLPYIVPTMIRELSEDKLIKLRYIVVPFVLMLFSVICNPYGLKVTNCLWTNIKNTNIYPVNETRPYNVLSLSHVYLMIFIVLFVTMSCILKHNNKRYKTYDFYMMIGWFLFSLTNARNSVFLAISYLYLMSYYIDCFSNYDIKKFINNINGFVKSSLFMIIVCMLIVVIGVCYKNVAKFTNVETVLAATTEGFDELQGRNVDKLYMQMLRHNVDTGAAVYTGFDAGSAAEFYGYKPYIDSRHSYDRMSEYVDIVRSDELKEPVANYKQTFDDKFENLIEKYDFDYYVVEMPYDHNIYDYLEERPESFSQLLRFDDCALFKAID